MIDAAFVRAWANVYKLRSSVLPPSGQTSAAYQLHLPAGLRLTERTEWDVERNLLAALANRPHLTRDQFLEVCYWKTGRVIGRAALNSTLQIRRATQAAIALVATNPQNAVNALLALNGVREPVASAIITMVRPDLATVIDIRALQTLHWNGALHSTNATYLSILAAEPHWPHNPTPRAVRIYRTDRSSWWGRVQPYWQRHYGDYVAICIGLLRAMRGPHPPSLRDLDRALWAAGGATEHPCCGGLSVESEAGPRERALI